jgi:hypothetical protein
MASTSDAKGPFNNATSDPHQLSDNERPKNSSEQEGSVQDEYTYQYAESQKLGITSSVFVILNKMIGTGIFSTPSGVFAATG